MGYNSSDIGYVNDIFMGGMIYIFILYGTVLRFLLRKPAIENFKNKTDYELCMLISKFLAVALLVSNFKGEVMRGGIVLLVAIFLKIVTSCEPLKEER